MKILWESKNEILLCYISFKTYPISTTIGGPTEKEENEN